MKKLLLIFILSIAVFHSFAQTTPWINVGAVWYYRWFAFGGPEGNDQIVYTHDTVINGKTCQTLVTTRSTYVPSATPPHPMILLSAQVIAHNYTYNNGDTVFYWVDSSFQVLYNFGAHPGNRWHLGMDTPPISIAMCTTSVVDVDSISTMLISGNTHRVLYTSDSLNSSYGFHGKMIEHIGSMEYLFPSPRNCNASVAIDYYLFTFSCFSDALESYSRVPSGECASSNPYHVGIIEQSNPASFTLYPNPAENKITITVANSYGLKVNIYNTLGELMLSEIPNDATFDVDISAFKSGMYLISIEDKTGTKQVKRFVKN